MAVYSSLRRKIKDSVGDRAVWNGAYAVVRSYEHGNYLQDPKL